MKASPPLCTIAALLSLCVTPASAQEDSCEGWDAAWNPSLFESLTAEIVTACIGGGQDPNIRDKNNATPLHKVSSFTRDLAVIAALLAGGADPNARDWDGVTALHTAAGNNPNPGILIALVEGGADVNLRSADGLTALHMSWHNDNPDVVHTLMELGADPLASDAEGRVADPTNCQHWATATFARMAVTEAVSRCLEAGVEVDAGDAATPRCITRRGTGAVPISPFSWRRARTAVRATTTARLLSTTRPRAPTPTSRPFSWMRGPM